jgi:hypothetical protein
MPQTFRQRMTRIAVESTLQLQIGEQRFKLKVSGQ